MSQTELVVSLLDEGLNTRGFPGIVYRDGPTGRRAALAVGPDVWEVISTVQYVEGSGDRKVSRLRRCSTYTSAGFGLAISFYAADPAEVDERIAANQAAMERAPEMAERREQLLA